VCEVEKRGKCVLEVESRHGEDRRRKGMLTVPGEFLRYRSFRLRLLCCKALETFLREVEVVWKSLGLRSL
jgi:hypothetical protein